MRAFLRVLGVGMVGLVCLSVYVLFFCPAPACTPFSVRKMSQVVDYQSCSSVGFPVLQTHPPRCIAGMRSFLADEHASLRVMEPQDGEEISLPLAIEGELRVETGSLRYRLMDGTGFAMVEDVIAVSRGSSGAYVSFAASVYYPRPLGTGGTLRLFTISPGTYVEENPVEIPLTFGTSRGVEVKLFFGSSERDPQNLACDTSYPVVRMIPVMEDVLVASLRELLRGPTLTEERQGFFTSIPEEVSVRSLTFEEGRVAVDFSSELSLGVAGLCRVQAIRSQIERTLKQFPVVRAVSISIGGSTEGTLEP